MNPVYWLLIVIVCAVALSTVVAAIFYGIGWDHCDTRHAEEQERHRHRDRDRVPGYMLELPTAGRLPIDPPLIVSEDPASLAYWRSLTQPAARVAMQQSDTGTWHFAGGWDEGPSGSAKYELLTRPAPEPELSDTGEMRALTDARIAQWEGDTNEFIHSMPRVIVRAD